MSNLQKEKLLVSILFLVFTSLFITKFISAMDIPEPKTVKDLLKDDWRK